MQPEDLAALRQDYKKAVLDLADAGNDPFSFFRKWLDEALAAGEPEPNAMTLATADAAGMPHARIVLLKGLEDGHFVFYTNYESNKAAEISGNGRAALVFFWPGLERQVRVEGTVAQVASATSDAYFAVRPRGSQLGAWASPQSREVAGRAALAENFRKTEQQFEGMEHVPRPPHWGGFGIAPRRIEFWQGRSSRMHDRVVFEREEGQGWKIFRLAP